MNKGPQIMRAMSGKRVEPVVVALTDLRAPGRKGNIQNAINFLRYHGIKMAIDNPRMLSTFGLDGLNLAVNDQTDYYLTEEERMREGPASIVSANMMHLKTSKPFEKAFFTHPVIGK